MLEQSFANPAPLKIRMDEKLIHEIARDGEEARHASIYLGHPNIIVFENHISKIIAIFREGMTLLALKIRECQFARSAPQMCHHLEIIVTIIADHGRIPFPVSWALQKLNNTGALFSKLQTRQFRSTEIMQAIIMDLCLRFSSKHSGQVKPMKKNKSHNPFFRVDLLTGCNNLVSFSDALSNNFENASLAPLSMIAIDVHQLSKINESRGRAFGDSLLRWFGFAIKDITGAGVYRVTGEDFVAVLVGETHSAHADKAGKLFERLNRDAEQFGLQPSIARVTVFHFPEGLSLDAAVVWKYLNEKHSFTADDQAFSIIEVDPNLKMSYETAQAIVLMAQRITDLGYMLENTFGMAYTDPISGSPNMLAIQHKLDLALEEAAQKHNPLSICLADGDDLRRYNATGYAAGDEVIRKLHAALASALRPDDFLGRWRMGDEFIVILPETNLEQAALVGERLRATVEHASQEWLHPTTISAGIASFPTHGKTVSALLQRAEQSLKAAKQAGKNRIRAAD